jgi:membrane protease YdiL (CAAX protease family)
MASFRNVNLGQGPDRIVQGAEVAVFLFLIVPSMVLSFFVIHQGAVGFVLTAVATILRDLALVFLVLFFLWRNREPFKVLGLKLRGFWREAWLGAALFVPMVYGTGFLEQFLLFHGFRTPSAPLPSLEITHHTGEVLLAAILVTVVAFSEEIIFRGYLLLRFQHLWESRLTAVLLSSFIFSLGHGYEGSAGVMTVGAMGAVFAVVYLWRGSLIAPITMHFLQDFVSIILAPFS